MPIREIRLPRVEESMRPMLHKHVCPPTFNGGPLDRLAPTRRVARNLTVNKKFPIAGGGEIEMWIFEDPDDPETGQVFPSKTIRTVEGDIVHATVGSKFNTHTTHWHGIEPSTMNDGVGKASFEISASFVYQFATNQAGTYFFHCHKNTVLHFIRGLFGLFIVDAPKPPAPEAACVPDPPYPAGGPGFAAAFNPPHHVRKYDVEGFIVPGEMDTRWEPLGHDAAMQKCDESNPTAPENFTRDGILHDFRPDVFHVNGHFKRITDPGPFHETDVHARVGQTVLIRVLNAGYTVQRFRIGLPVEVTSMDGHPLGVHPEHAYSHPFRREANEQFSLTVAMRQELFIEAARPGEFPIEIEFVHFTKRTVLYTARTFINVTQ